MADVVSTLRGWSATAASNLPAGTTSIGTGLDDNLRELQAVIRKYLASTASNMASGATVDLSTADGYYVQITGTTTITALGTESAGIQYLLRFAGALTFTHNATSLILPGKASITTAAGDMALMISEGSGNWRCVSYQLASGYAPAVVNVLDYGTLTGTNDNTMVAAAFVAGAGKRIHFPPGTYAINDLTWPANTIFTGDGVTSIIKKRANGDIGTIGAMSEVHDLYFDLNGTNFTGRGFVISTGAVDFVSWRKFIGSHFIDSYSYAIEYTQNLAGYSSLMQDCYFTMSSAGATPYATPAVKLPAATETNGNRHFLRCNSGGYILVDLGGCNNVNMSMCLMAPPLMSSTSTKVVISNCRIVTRSDSSVWTVNGVSNVIVGNTIAQLLITFASTCDELFWDGNATPDTTFTDNATGDTNDNKIYLPSQVYTPTWGSTGSAPSIGDGQIFGSYTRRGEDCRARITFSPGSTSTYGTGNYTFTLPYAAADVVSGTAIGFDTSAQLWYVMGAIVIAAGNSTLRVAVNGAGYMTSASPITWASGDVLYIDIDYRIA